MKTIIDANVILRYLLRDNEEMYLKATEIINKGACTLYEIIAEVVYVLSGVYNVSREEIAYALDILLDEIEISEVDVMKYALNLYKREKIDFVDCIIIAKNKVLGSDIFTFDKKINKIINGI